MAVEHKADASRHHRRPVERLRALTATLKVRLALASVVVITCCIALSTQLVLNRVHTGVQQAVMDLERGNAERMASLLSSRIVGLQTALRTLADDPQLKAAADDPAALRARLAATHTLRTLFASLFVAQPDGRVVALVDGDGARDPGISIADRAYFQKTARLLQPVVSEPLMGRLSKEPIVQLTVPVIGAQGRLLAVVGGTLRLASRNLLAELTQDSSAADDPVVTLVMDGSGNILSHRIAQRVMTPAAAEPGLASAIARWERQGRPIEVTGDATAAGGTIVASAGVAVADWVVLRVASEDTLLGGLVAARRDSLLLAATVALAGGLLLLGLLGWLLRPLARLRRRALALGDAELPIDEGWPDAAGEIGQLGAVLRRAMQDRSASGSEAANLLRMMKSVLAAAPIGIAFSRNRRLELVSREFAALLGWPEDALAGQPNSVLYASQGEYEAMAPQVVQAFDAGLPFVTELQFRRRDGSTLWGRLQGRPVEAGQPDAGTIWLLEDVTLQRAELERLSWSASHDALTRLANRSAFELRMQALLNQQSADAAAPPSVLLFIDLDHFKRINDNAGHAAGDQVLQDVAGLLTASVRASDLVARLGGDEFAVLMPRCELDTALRVADRIRAGTRLLGSDVAGKRLAIGASIGAVLLEAGLGRAELMARADSACYAAKRAGRDVVHLAQPLA